MEITKHTEDQIDIKFNENPDAAQVQQWTDEFKSQLDGKEKLARVDLTGLAVISSLGVNVIVGLYKKMQDQGGKVEVIAANESMIRVFELFKLSDLFNIHLAQEDTAK